MTAELASLLRQLARTSGEDGAVAQAQSLHLRALSLVEADANAYADAVVRLAHKGGGDVDLGRSLERAADALLDIADTAADVAALAAFVGERAREDLVPDALAAALLAEAATRAAAMLVEVNLAVRADDDRARRARDACAAAASAVSQLRPGATNPLS
jgi:methenyltetrahydrofolate cyclohydrolase